MLASAEAAVAAPPTMTSKASDSQRLLDAANPTSASPSAAEDTITSTDLKSHRDLLATADVVVTMTAEQKRLVAALADGAARPTLTLRELAGESGDIADPMGQGEETYRACRDEIARCLAKGFDRLLA